MAATARTEDLARLKIRTARESVGWLNTEGPLTVSPKFDRPPELAALHADKIAACREATGEFRSWFSKADALRMELNRLGICNTCAIGEHLRCRDYGCICCGAGK